MKALLGRGVLSLAIALGIPLVQLLIVCRRDPVSEACVWGKAYLPLSLALYAVLVTPVAFLGLWAISAARRRRR